jgi:hypothetical protein
MQTGGIGKKKAESDSMRGHALTLNPTFEIA